MKTEKYIQSLLIVIIFLFGLRGTWLNSQPTQAPALWSSFISHENRRNLVSRHTATPRDDHPIVDMIVFSVSQEHNNLPRQIAHSRLFVPNIDEYNNVIEELRGVLGSPNTSDWQGVKISGHNSYLVWHKASPDKAFVVKVNGDSSVQNKTTNSLKRSHWITAALEGEFPQNPEFHFLPERTGFVGFGEKTVGNIIRDFQTPSKLTQEGLQLWPMHAFLGLSRDEMTEKIQLIDAYLAQDTPDHIALQNCVFSKPVIQAAASNGLTPLAWFLTELIPRLARIQADLHYKAGIHGGYHTQNLLLGIDDNNHIRTTLARDAHDHMFDFVIRLATRKPLFPEWLTGERPAKIINTYNQESIDDPMIITPGGFMMRYFGQLLFFDISGIYSSDIVLAFLDAYAARTKELTGVNVKVSRTERIFYKVKQRLLNLKKRLILLKELYEILLKEPSLGFAITIIIERRGKAVEDKFLGAGRFLRRAVNRIHRQVTKKRLADLYSSQDYRDAISNRQQPSPIEGKRLANSFIKNYKTGVWQVIDPGSDIDVIINNSFKGHSFARFGDAILLLKRKKIVAMAVASEEVVTANPSFPCSVLKESRVRF